MIPNEKLRRLVDLKREEKELDSRLEETKAERKLLEDEIWSSMETNGDKTLNKELGPGYGTISFGRRETVFGRVLDKETAAATLRALGLDHVLEPGFKKRIINEITRERLEQGQPPLEGFDHYSNRYVSVSIKGE